MKMHSKPLATAVVFANQDMGVRCLEALIELGVEIGLVVTDTDQENRSDRVWFAGVAEMAKRNGLPVVVSGDPNSNTIIKRTLNFQPDFIFCFFYDYILGQELLQIPAKGAFNLHGSLLPKYRGPVPVSWAIIHGEKECGMSLHRMECNAAAGDLVAQRTIPILSNDTAFEVFQKLKCVAESMLLDIVPEMIADRVIELPQNLESGSYFSVRKLEDAQIDWRCAARDIHNLIRSASPPFHGAYFFCNTHRFEILSSCFRGLKARFSVPTIYVENGCFWADCACGERFMITEFRINQLNVVIKKSDQGSFVDLCGNQIMSNLFTIEPLMA